MNDTAPRPATRQPSGWWHRNRWYLLGIVPLAAWALFVPYRSTTERLERVEPGRRALVVATDQNAHYAGAQWRMIDRRILTPPGGVNPFRSDANVLTVAYEITIDAGGESGDTIGCETRVSDALGRRWQSRSLSIQMTADEELPSSCTSQFVDFEFVYIQPEQPHRFRHFYLVPDDLTADELRPEVIITAPPGMAEGRLLRFADQ